jgi:hypothetical protein
MPVRRFALAFAVGLVLVTASAGARAQEMEPRAYSNSPVGFNFLVVGYVYSEGGLSLDPALPVDDARLAIHSGFIAYARALDVLGTSGRIDVLAPYSNLSGTALVEGQPVTREVSGFGEPRFRLSLNLYGAPALSAREFAGYHKDLVIGASVQVAVPGGQYDPSKAINLGSNRWTIKPDLGFSKALGAFTLDVTTSAIFYSDNDDFFGGNTLAQAPIYAAQANVSYDFGDGVWAAVGSSYYRGGRTTLNGHESSVELGNARAGATLALPFTRQHSLKLNYSRGVYTRSGTDFTILGIAWQYRWGSGP